MRLTAVDLSRRKVAKLGRWAVDYGTKYVGRINIDNYVFTPPAPIAVRDKVSSREDKSKRGLCLQEMALMLACWNEHDYSETICAKEIQAFEKCWKEAEKRDKILREQEKLGISSSTGRMTSAQANKMLKRFPEPPSS